MAKKNSVTTIGTLAGGKYSRREKDGKKVSYKKGDLLEVTEKELKVLGAQFKPVAEHGDQ